MEEKERKQNTQSPHSSKSPAAKSEKGHTTHVQGKEEGKNKVDGSLLENVKA
jgi:hypothetical protein